MDLDQHFLWMVETAIEELWEASTITRVARCSWARTNLDAVCYCIDHELFALRNPEIARCVHRAVDMHGHLKVSQFIAASIRLTEDPVRPFDSRIC